MAPNADVGRLAPNSDELTSEAVSSHSLKAQRSQRETAIATELVLAYRILCL